MRVHQVEFITHQTLAREVVSVLLIAGQQFTEECFSSEGIAIQGAMFPEVVMPEFGFLA